ncbi:MAG: VWA domain-containing protein, partial [Bacteroidota bacterium]
WGSKREKVTQKSIDVFIALDISNSMNAQDIKPSRLERAKRFTSNLVENLKGERIGLILFAGNAYLQMPLTNDYAAATLFVNSANTNMAPSQGTAIVDAIDMAEQSFDEENEFHKALIIISDGENHDEEALVRAREAADNGLIIYSIGVGTTQGGFIPVVNAQGYNEYKKDKSGKFVSSQLNEELLNELAISGDGNYYHITNANQIFDDLENKIASLDKKEYEQRSFKEYNSYFQYFLLFGILCLILEFILSNRKNKWLKSDDILKV